MELFIFNSPILQAKAIKQNLQLHYAILNESHNLYFLPIFMIILHILFIIYYKYYQKI